MSEKKSLLSIEQIARAGLIAALYIALVFLFKPISFSNIQVRIAEALTVLAFIDPAAILGLYVGVLIANIFGGLGPIDIFFGSFLTLVAAAMTYGLSHYFKNKTEHKTYRYVVPIFALLPVVIVNAFGVAYILNVALKLPYFPSVISVAIGQLIAVYVLGYPFLQAIMNTPIYSKNKN